MKMAVYWILYLERSRMEKKWAKIIDLMRKFKIIIPEKCNSNAERYFNASSALFFLNQATFAWIEMDAINCNLFIFNDRKNVA